MHRQAGGVWRGRSTRALPDDAKRAFGQNYERTDKGAALTADAKRWEGWGTALKPAHEPIALARKPFKTSVADNVLVHGTGAINVDACRIGWLGEGDKAAAAAAAQRTCRDTPGRERWAGGDGKGHAYGDPVGSLATWEAKADIGRWPANVITDGSLEVLEAFPSQAREAIRFFYAAKASREEREYGLSGVGGVGALRDGKRAVKKVVNVHPTVKPIDLMRWLCRLVTPPGGVVLEPFMGSGSTGIAALREGFHFVGIEQSPEYFAIAAKRIAQAAEDLAREPDLVRQVDRAVHALRAKQMALEL